MIFGIIVVVSLIREKNTRKIIDLIVLQPEQPSPPDTLPIEKHEIKLTNRALHDNLLKVSVAVPSVFICKENGEALFEWLEVQKYFIAHGYTSYVFSFSGFKNSAGTPTRKRLFEDALAAYHQCVALTPNTSRCIGLAHS